MTQAYSDPSRESDPHALPDIEVFELTAHEVAESVTDPTGQTWYEDGTGMENADIVAWLPLPYGPWTAQGYWTNEHGNTVGAYQVPVQPPPPVWQPDPALVTFYEDWETAAAWCGAQYARAKSPDDAARAAAYARSVIAACDLWLPYLGKPGHMAPPVLPEVPHA